MLTKFEYWDFCVCRAAYNIFSRKKNCYTVFVSPQLDTASVRCGTDQHLIIYQGWQRGAARRHDVAYLPERDNLAS
jgi:hypothetical protein